nr:helix-turn-helix transcriptional regulator [Sphingomonas lycopersici]
MVEARKQQALTQQAVADKIGKPQQYVSRYETGERRLDIFEFIDVAAALDVDALSLIRTAPEAN